MFDKIRRTVVPVYVLLCLLLGGSSQGIWRNMVVQLLAIALIAWAALSRRPERPSSAARILLLLFAAGVLLFVVQLVPLPPDVWAAFPGREILVRGYTILGYELPWLPISMAPYETFETVLTLLPPLAVVLGIVRLGAYDGTWMTAAILLGAFLHVLLGTLQSAGGGWPNAWWYLYDITNPGAVGFFANRNHMGTLLLVSIPFCTILLSARASTGSRSNHGLTILGGSGLLVILVGLVLNQSLAALVLAVPVIGASGLLLPRSWRQLRFLVPVVALAAILAAVVLTTTPVRSELSGSDTSSVEIRRDIWTVTSKAVGETFPLGTGFGTFEQVYPRFEEANVVERTYINHAHNDFLEVAMEGGAPGLLLILAFLAWWTFSVVRIWRSPSITAFVKAATIASGAILAHSIVDYPLRTAAIAAVFAACAGLMARASERPRALFGDRDRPRHQAIG